MYNLDPRVLFRPTEGRKGGGGEEYGSEISFTPYVVGRWKTQDLDCLMRSYEALHTTENNHTNNYL